MDSLHTMAKNDFLSRIVHDKWLEIASRRAKVSAEALATTYAEMPPANGALDHLRGDRLRVIAEVKRGSPSAGTFNAGLDAGDQASLYASAGAAVISVLTDGPYFGGSLEDLEAARRRVDIPLLRKDFIIDEYQLFEARASGADLILLIVAALRPAMVRVLLEQATKLGLSTLVEVNTEREAAIALEAGASLIGINNRDLHTFTVDMGTTARVRPSIPDAVVVAALSGIKTPEQARAMRDAGANAVLVGEALVRSSDPSALIGQMMEIA
jgi:indole-3-glycerol phosphate synthase